MKELLIVMFNKIHKIEGTVCPLCNYDKKKKSKKMLMPKGFMHSMAHELHLIKKYTVVYKYFCSHCGKTFYSYDNAFHDSQLYQYMRKHC